MLTPGVFGAYMHTCKSNLTSFHYRLLSCSVLFLLQLDGKMKMGTRMLSPTSIADLMDGSGGIGSNGSVNIFSTKNNNNNNNSLTKGPNKRRAGSDEDMDEGMLSVEAGVEALRASKAIKVRVIISRSTACYFYEHLQTHFHPQRCILGLSCSILTTTVPFMRTFRTVLYC
jgi:hypothetical protein